MKVAVEIINILKKEGNPANVSGMARYGIRTEKAFGVSIPFIRNLGKKYRNEHELALKLWKTGYHEARILAGIIDNPDSVTEKQMEDWVNDFDSWDICDQCCSNLFVLTPFAYSKAIEWTKSEEEFTKRAEFVMMACISVKTQDTSIKTQDKLSQKSNLRQSSGQEVKRKKIIMNNEAFVPFLKLIEKNATDERNMVKKAVNWALRQIGKRNSVLNELALEVTERLLKSKDKTTLWIARDAYRELKSEAVQKKLKVKS